VDQRLSRDSSEYNVRAIERALQILNCFDDEHPARGITDIAQAVGLHKATVHRIVTTLTNYGYLERLLGGQEYQLGIQLAALGAGVAARMDLRRVALPFMQQLVRVCEESCDLGILEGGDVLVVEIVRSPHGHALASELWRRLPVHATASGKIFLASLPLAARTTLLSNPLPSFTGTTITDPELLNRELETTRMQGYAIDNEEFEVGVRGVAAPIRNQEGNVVASLGMPGPTGRITLERLPAIVDNLIQGAEAISRRLGWQA
jgi:DNA-binding IclR family transcriptional regulator